MDERVTKNKIRDGFQKKETCEEEAMMRNGNEEERRGRGISSSEDYERSLMVSVMNEMLCVFVCNRLTLYAPV